MTQEMQHFGGAHAATTRGGRGVYVALGVSLFLLACVLVGLYLFHTQQVRYTSSYTDGREAFLVGTDGTAAGVVEDVPEPASTPEQEEEAATEVAEEEIYPEGFPTPLVAEYDGVLIHSPIAADQINGIMFHQASFENALVMQTQLPTADPEYVEATHNFEIATDQPTGDEYLKAKALHIWRMGAITDMDTSIDVGAEAGTQTYAPITGTVTKIREYDLFDTCKDFEVHIAPEGREDVDVVQIHITDIQVKEGDKVVGGVTPVAKVRDINAEGVDEIQLAGYTDAGHGNHTHVQVNDPAVVVDRTPATPEQNDAKDNAPAPAEGDDTPAKNAAAEDAAAGNPDQG